MSSARLVIDAWRELLRRYAAVFAASWRERRTWDLKRYQPGEAEFLPAALSLQQQAVSPAPRVAMWLLIVFSVLAVLWSVLGRVDIVATATGKIIPSAGTQVVQPIGTATVKAIHVREGQFVSAGELLVELDETVTHADQQRIVNELQAWALQVAHAEAALGAIERSMPPVLATVDAPPRAVADTLRLARAEFLALQAKLAGLDADALLWAPGGGKRRVPVAQLVLGDGRTVLNMVEEVFAWPGLAAATVDAALSADLPLLAAVTALSAAAIIAEAVSVSIAVP